MVKLIVGGGADETFEELPKMNDVTLLLAAADFLAADKEYADRLKFIFKIEDVPDEEHEVHIGKEHWVYANMPAGKTGKLKANSNLYKVLEGLSGGDFDPEDEIDTDEYVGKKYIGDFKREQRQEMIAPGKFVPKFDANNQPVKKTVLRNVRPLRPARASRPKAEPEQTEHEWDDD